MLGSFLPFFVETKTTLKRMQMSTESNQSNQELHDFTSDRYEASIVPSTRPPYEFEPTASTYYVLVYRTSGKQVDFNPIFASHTLQEVDVVFDAVTSGDAGYFSTYLNSTICEMSIDVLGDLIKGITAFDVYMENAETRQAKRLYSTRPEVEPIQFEQLERRWKNGWDEYEKWLDSIE